MQGNFSPNAASVTLSGPGTLDLTSTGQSFTQDVTVDPQQADSDNAADYPWTCCKKQPRPEGCKKCPDMPKAPPCKWSHVHLLAYIRMIKASVRWKMEIYNLSCKILLCSLSFEENTAIISRWNLQFLDHSKKWGFALRKFSVLTGNTLICIMGKSVTLSHLLCPYYQIWTTGFSSWEKNSASHFRLHVLDILFILFQWPTYSAFIAMTCTKTVPMDTQTATTPGGRSIVPRDATFAKVSKSSRCLVDHELNIFSFNKSTFHIYSQSYIFLISNTGLLSCSRGCAEPHWSHSDQRDLSIWGERS